MDALIPTTTPSGKRVRFRVLYGGRDGAKSWSIARRILQLGVMRPLRVLCTREVQKSISESVHQLLRDQVAAMGLSSHYEVQQQYIRGVNGTQIAFHGLSGQTASSIKSFEGIDICWLEEAQTISKRSWDLLEPTIRAEGSEIWASFNPDMDTDETYRRFVVNPPDDALVVQIGWQDNPWRSKALDSARERMAREAPDDYAHIYGGQCRPAIEGAIYFGEVSSLRQAGRLCNVPYDPMLKVHVVADLGFNDFMSLILVQRLASEIRIIRYIEDRMRTIPSYSEELRALNLNWGKVWLPHDARAKTLTSSSNPLGASAEEQFRKLGWDVEIVENVEIEQGIRKVREVFPRLYMDKTNASELLNRLGRYRRRVNSEGQASTPLHDDESHGADGMRYVSLIADQLANETVNLGDYYAAFR
ncbi:MAG: PBSX family phage terminase large subunit [Gammaproteobacteria bacterium]|nr:PBSX family phage terminase large subunit [Gammaproteobacteria bacterium]